MSNPWVLPMWIMLAINWVMCALMQVTLHTSAWAPIAVLWGLSFILWGSCAFQAWRYDR